MTISIINPLTDPIWKKEFAQTTGDFFHTANWAQVLNQTYSFSPRYYVNVESHSAVPLFITRDIKQRKKAVCLPFTDETNVIGQPHTAQHLFKQIQKDAPNNNWQNIVFHGSSDLFIGVEPSCTFFGHSLDLTLDEKMLFKNLRDSTRRHITHAKKQNIEIRISTDHQSIKQFYDLHCITRKRHGTPPQPFSYFKNLVEHCIAKGLGYVVTAFYGTLPVASNVYVCTNSQAIYKFGASDMRFAHMRPSNLVFWEGIREAARRGIKELRMGRTDTWHDGLLQFKRGWGAKEYRIHYYYYSVKQNKVLKINAPVKNAPSALFSTLPISLLKLIGSQLYRFMS